MLQAVVIKLINSYLAFFIFSMTTLLQLGEYKSASKFPFSEQGIGITY